MCAKKKPAEEPEEPSRAAGACVLIVLVGIVTAAVFAVSETAGPLFVWGAGTLALWYYVRRTANPAPPPPPERGSDENPQFTVTSDGKGRSTVHWQKEVNDA